MLPKYFNFVLSVFVVILSITSIQCDVSHIVLGAESPVHDASTIDLLTRNISDYLVQLEHGGSPQMQLQQIYSVTKQIVTGTLYTVEARLATPDGAKNCQIRVLEKPWIDFCQVSVTCENGGRYEVTFNPSQSGHDISQHLATAEYLPPTRSPATIYQYQQPQVTFRPNPFLNQLPTTQAVTRPPFQFFTQPTPGYTYKPPTPAKFEFKPQPVPVYRPVAPVYQPQLPVKVQTTPLPPTPFKFTQQPVKFTQPPFKFTQPPAPVFNYPTQAPTKAPTPPKFEYKPQPVPVFQPQTPIFRPQPTTPPPPPPFTFTQQPVKFTQPPFKFTQPPAPVFNYPTQAPTQAPTPAPTQAPTPPKYQPLFDIRGDLPETHDFPIKGHGVPKPVFPEPPELNVLSYDQVPQNPAELQTYLHGLFDDFMARYKRQYIDEPHEQEFRRNVFINNFHSMHENARSDRLSCQYSVTEFSDLTQDEFGRIMGFNTFSSNSSDAINADIPSLSSKDLPEKYDQRDENLVTRVKFQGDCGACWAFVTTAVIEGLCAKRTKKLQEFSEQSLIDCDNSNFGCKGGVPPKAMKHIAQRGGLELESVYPFVYDKSSCKFDKKNVRVKVSGVVGFKKNDEEGMAKWLFKNGPILVGINAAPLQYYKGGVLNPTPELCSPKKINHGVTLIGFGVEVNTSTGEKLPYWIAKNQWGTRFGEDGYFRIARGKNACGLALWANSVKLANVTDNCLLNGA